MDVQIVVHYGTHTRTPSCFGMWIVDKKSRKEILAARRGLSRDLTEAVGFEPTSPCGLPDFESVGLRATWYLIVPYSPQKVKVT